MSKNLYFKLTTVPDYSEKAVELYYKKYRDSNKLEDLKKAEEDFYKNAGKNPLFGKIYSITVGYVNGNEIRTTVLKGSEKDILTEFLNLANSDHFKGYQMCGWNFSFLLPFLRVRSKKNEVSVSFHKDLEDLSKKAWTITGLDLFDSWKGLGWFSSSLEEVAELTFGINTDFVDGEDVYDLYNLAGFEKLDKSSSDEVITLINVHRLIKGDNYIEAFSNSVKELEEVKDVEQPLLQKIYQTKNFSEQVKKEIRGFRIESDEDKENLKKIILAHYQSKNDKVAVKKQKETEVNEYIDSLC